MKAVRVLFTPELMRSALSLPDGVDIIGASWRGHYIELVIAGEQFPDVPKEGNPVLAEPIFRKQPEVVLVSWGLRE